MGLKHKLQNINLFIEPLKQYHTHKSAVRGKLDGAK